MDLDEVVGIVRLQSNISARLRASRKVADNGQWSKRTMPTRDERATFAKRKEQFAAPFYTRHHSHVFQWLSGCGMMWLVVAGGVVLVNLLALFAGSDQLISTAWSDWLRFAGAVAILRFIIREVVDAHRDQFVVRVLPYFERTVGDTNTWLAGEDLLWHSRALDELAVRSGVTPLSAFSSGDDLVAGETLCWFKPADALRTIERLLEAETVASLPAGVVSDLERLCDALRRANAQGIRFCLLVREGSFASSIEMDQRKGSFF